MMIRTFSDSIQDFTRLFSFGEGLAITYHHRVAIFRVMGSGDDARAILWERWPAEFLREFPEGINLSLMGGLCTDPSDFSEGETILTMRNCRSRRWWIPDPKRHDLTSVDRLSYWLEIEFDA